MRADVLGFFPNPPYDGTNNRYPRDVEILAEVARQLNSSLRPADMRPALPGLPARGD